MPKTRGNNLLLLHWNVSSQKAGWIGTGYPHLPNPQWQTLLAARSLFNQGVRWAVQVSHKHGVWKLQDVPKRRKAARVKLFKWHFRSGFVIHHKGGCLQKYVQTLWNSISQPATPNNQISSLRGKLLATQNQQKNTQHYSGSSTCLAASDECRAKRKTESGSSSGQCRIE